MRIVKKYSLMIARKVYNHHFLENFVFSKKLILLQTVCLRLIFLLIGLTILLIEGLIEQNFSALSFLAFLILFFFYLFIRVYNNSEKRVKRY